MISNWDIAFVRREVVATKGKVVLYLECTIFIYLSLLSSSSLCNLQNDTSTNVTFATTNVLPTLEDYSVPRHSSGVYEETEFRKKDNFKHATLISEEQVRVNSYDLDKVECSKSHRYCSFQSGQITNFEDPAIRGPFEDHSPYYCSCATDCASYGDCCWDAPITDYLQEEESSDNDDEESDDSEIMYSCVESLPGKWHYFYSKCSKTWVVKDVKEQCEKDANTFYPFKENKRDYLAMVPVTSTENNVTYKNIFCAVCNNQKALVAWRVVLQCRPPKGSKLKNNTLPKMSSNCPVHFTFPKEIPELEKFVFNCVDNPIGSSCNSNSPSYNSSAFREKHYAKKCDRFYAPVFGNTTGFRKSFKNKFCAFCDGENNTELDCETGTRRNTPQGDYGFFRPTLTGTRHFLPSYSMVLDIDFSSGGTKVGSSTRCPPGAVFDPFTDDCRNVVCGENYEYSDGLCISKRSTDTIDISGNIPTSDPPTPIDSCPMIIVSEAYERRENDSIFLRGRDIVIEKGEYKIQDNGTVMICMDTSQNPYVAKFNLVQSVLTTVCLSVSIICLALKITLFFVVPEGKKIAPKAIVCLSLCLFVAQLLFLVGVERKEWGWVCAAIGVVIHFSFLASFFWCNILAYDIWHTFHHSGIPKSETSTEKFGLFFKYSCYAWLTPLCIVSVTITLNFFSPRLSKWNPGYGENVCWISNKMSLITYFAVPLAFLLLINTFFFVSTAIIIYRASKATKIAHENTGVKDRIRLSLYAKLGLIMGLTWIFGFVAPYSKSGIIWCIFIVLNGLQGAFVFFSFTKFDRVRRKLFGSSSEQNGIGSTNDSRTREPNRLQFGLGKSGLAVSNTNITNV